MRSFLERDFADPITLLQITTTGTSSCINQAHPPWYLSSKSATPTAVHPHFDKLGNSGGLNDQNRLTSRIQKSTLIWFLFNSPGNDFYFSNRGGMEMLHWPRF